MHSIRLIYAAIFVALSASIQAQATPSTAVASTTIAASVSSASSSPTFDNNLPSSDVIDILTGIAGPSATNSISPAQVSKLGQDFGSYILDLSPSALTNDPFSFVRGKNAPSLAPGLSSSIQDAIEAIETGNPTALSTLQALVSGQTFSSALIAEETALVGAFYSESAGLASIAASDLGITVPTSSSSSSSGLAAAPTAEAGVVGAAIAAAAGVVGMALL